MSRTRRKISVPEAKELGIAPIVDGVVPPHDLDAEAAVLSSVLIDPSAMAKVADMIVPRDFYSEAHSRIWEVCQELDDLGTPIDVVMVGTRLP